MDKLFRSALGVHIAFGTVALIIAPLAMITVKGGRWHRRWGKIYFWSMAGVALSATVMCWLRSGLFLFLVAIFSFYLALTGYSVLRRKKPGDKAGVIDWCAALAVLLAGVGLIVSGALATDPGERKVRMIFGLISLLLGAGDVRSFLRPPVRDRAWWFSHMTRFIAAYIATVTAFSVLNFRFLPYVWRWLGPTVIGAIGIVIWRRYYARKFARQRSAALTAA
ncbi:MAG TPA: hypothetical protein VH518_04410 [Tepidisphaeraceae bacterium]|jgi:uncharacterized membrane protein